MFTTFHPPNSDGRCHATTTRMTRIHRGSSWEDPRALPSHRLRSQAVATADGDRPVSETLVSSTANQARTAVMIVRFSRNPLATDAAVSNSKWLSPYTPRRAEELVLQYAFHRQPGHRAILSLSPRRARIRPCPFPYLNCRGG